MSCSAERTHTSASSGRPSRLYAEELAVLMGVWESRLLTEQGTRILYREDAAALDALVPLSVYTDMYHYVSLSRLGLVVVEGVEL